jgi:hypothetical protein
MDFRNLVRTVMHASGWIELIRAIPSDIHTSLTILMLNGAEINLQGIVRMEEQFLVCRGRTAGTVDGNLIFFLPYDQINTMLCNKPVKEDVVHTWFNREPFHSLDGAFMPAGVTSAPSEPGMPSEQEELEAGVMPGSESGVPLQPARPAPAAAGKQEPVVPTVSARPAPGPQMATAQMAMNNMILPAKAAMIERLRKKAQTGGPGANPKPPDQK